MEMEVIVLSAKRFDGEFNGQRFKNCKIQYISEISEDTQMSKGHQVVEVKGDFDLYNDITELPGKYKMKVNISPSGKGGVKITPIKFDFIGKIDLEVV